MANPSNHCKFISIWYCLYLDKLRCNQAKEKFNEFLGGLGSIKSEILDIYENNINYKFNTKSKLKELNQVI